MPAKNVFSCISWGKSRKQVSNCFHTNANSCNGWAWSINPLLPLSAVCLTALFTRDFLCNQLTVHRNKPGRGFLGHQAHSLVIPNLFHMVCINGTELHSDLKVINIIILTYGLISSKSVWKTCANERSQRWGNELPSPLSERQHSWLRKQGGILNTCFCN